MRSKILASLAVILPLASALAAGKAAPTRQEKEKPMGVHAFSVESIDGKTRNLADYKGKVLLIVNTASECGFTPQYKGLEALYRSHKGRGFMVLGFPCDDFGGQEPGTEAEIKAFCESNYGVSFDLFAKIHAKGEAIAPLYRYLTGEAGFDGEIGWNFTKFLVGKDGTVLGRWASKVKPDDPELLAAIDRALAAD